MSGGRRGVDVPVVGRDAELTALRERIARATAGREFVVLEGEPGIGKTRLLNEAVQMAAECGFDVLISAGQELEQARPYGLLLAAFERRGTDERAQLRDLVAHPQQGDADRRLAVIDWFTSFVERTTDAAPIALLLDDLHWADEETLQVLRALVRRDAPSPFVLVGALRPAPASRELEQLVGAIEERGLRIAIDPLDESTVGELVDRLVAEHVTPELLARAASARGNPFFVIEILAGGLSDDDPTEISKDLRRTVLRRVIHLSEEAVAMLRVGSLLGTSIDPAELAAVLRRSAIDLVPLLDEAIKSGVLEDRDGAIVFRHDIVREALYRDMPESLRRRSHRDVGRSLAAAGAPARRVAMHLARAAHTSDGEAVSWLRRAASEEMQRAPTAAADMLAQAADLVDASEPEHGEIQAERAQALAWAGRVSEASELATQVLDVISDPELAATIRASLGESLTFRGYLVEACAHLEAAARDAARPQRALLLAEAAGCRLMSGAIGPASDLVDRVLAELDVTDDPRARSLALGVSGMVTILRGDRSGLEIAREAVRVADADFLGESHRYLGRVFLGYALHEMGLHSEALDVLREGLRLDEARGVTWSLPCYHGLLGLLHFHRGEWDDAVAELETAKAVLDDMDSTFLAPMTHGLLAQIALHRDDRAAAERELADGEAKLGKTGLQYGAELLVQTRAMLTEDDDDITTAHAMVRGLWDVAEAMGLRLVFGFTAPAQIRLALAEGDDAAGVRAVTMIEDLAGSMQTGLLEGIALLCRAMIESEPATVLRAVDTLRIAGRPLYLAEACEEAASILARSGQPAAASERLAEAIAIYEDVGASREARRASRSLGDGARRRQPAKRRPVSGWASLSRTERRVVELVAEGLTNPAIAERLVVSRRTVETHVSHLFRKLGVTSRVELVLRATKELAAEVP